jgi:hypothetical protein
MILLAETRFRLEPTCQSGQPIGDKQKKTYPTLPHFVLRGNFQIIHQGQDHVVAYLMRMTFGPPCFLNVANVASRACLSIFPSNLKLWIPCLENKISIKSSIDVPTEHQQRSHRYGAGENTYIANSKLSYLHMHPTLSKASLKPASLHWARDHHPHASM